MKMRARILALGSAGALLIGLGAGTAFADPAAGDPYTQNPTPQERAQTQQLNVQASEAAQATSDAQMQNDAAQAQYQQQQDQYQNDRARYQAQKDRYLDERAEYNFDRSHPYAWWHERYARATLNRLHDIPRTELIDLRVVRDDGFVLGHIRNVDRAPDGRVMAVQVRFRNGDLIWVKARTLRYDVDDRIVFTDLSYPEIRELDRNS
jgi:hypothetical protein